ERVADPAGALDLRHRHRRVHGGGDVDLPGSRREKRRRQEGEVADRFGAPMTLHYRAAVLDSPHSPLQIETVAAAPIAPSDVLVRVRAAGLCHTDLEVIDGSLRYPMPIVLGHEAAGVIEEVGPAVRRQRRAITLSCRGTRIAATATIATAAFQSCARIISPRARRRCSSTAPLRRGA